MIIFNKKRIMFLVMAITISILTPSLMSLEQKTVQIVALPVSNKVIVLDAGHRFTRRAVQKVQMA